MSTTFHIEPEVKELFRSHGVDHPSAWLDGQPGKPVSADKSHDVRRVTLGGETFYLKRRWSESRGSLIGMIFFGRRPASGPVREAALAIQLRTAGFSAMEPVAWGEKRRWGLPVKGFSVIRAVAGESVENAYAQADEASRRRLLAQAGELTGKLHSAGFFHHVRLKDLILSPAGELVLIDRESGRPWKRRFSLGTALTALARTVRRTLRDGHRFGGGEAGAFFRGYHLRAEGCLALTPKEFRRKAMRRIRAELKG